MKITYDEGVFEELVNLSTYLADRDEEIAHRFLDSCNGTFQLLAKNPGIGSPRRFEDPALSEIRMWRVKGFEKYLVFYLPTETGIRILHVIHSSIDYNRVFEDE